MFGLVVIEGMNLSGHPWIINEIRYHFAMVYPVISYLYYLGIYLWLKCKFPILFQHKFSAEYMAELWTSEE